MHRIVVWRSTVGRVPGPSLLEKGSWEGETPVLAWEHCALAYTFYESSCLGLQLKFGGKFHLKLNIGGIPIVHKYREGKMQRTLKRELKSTWNCWKVSEGNQCRRYSIFPGPLVVWALCYIMGYRGFGMSELVLEDVSPFGVLYLLDWKVSRAILTHGTSVNIYIVTFKHGFWLRGVQS